MDRPSERVYTIDDWYDGARAGAADFGGHPHYYRSIYLDTPKWNPDEDRFELTPITADIVGWMVEAQELHQRWYARYRAGTAPNAADDAPRVLPEDQGRYELLNRRVEAALKHTRPTVLARGAFDYRRDAVQWTPIANLVPSRGEA